MPEQADNYCVVMTTCASAGEAMNLADTLLDAKLAACVQVVDINSYYTWKGVRTHDAEKLLLIKTRRDLYERVETALRGAHSYETPEIVEVPISRGLDRYFAWIDEVVM